MKKFYSVLIFISILNIVIFYQSAYGQQPGTLDKSFGENGKVVDPFENIGYIEASLILENDAIITGTISGNIFGPFGFFLVKYTKDGIIDSSFGENGTVLTFLDNHSVDGLSDLALQKDGKIIAVGVADQNIALARYMPDGTLDSSFGVNGTVVTDFGYLEYGRSVSIQEDGKIVVGAQKYDINYISDDFLIVRYLSDGSLDETFGIGGMATRFISGGESLTATAIQKDGKILAAGTSQSGGSSALFNVYRYLPNGTMDSSFGINGIVKTDFGPSEDELKDMVLQDDQKIVVAGTTGFYNEAMAVARYNPDGKLDNNFGTGGKTTIAFNDWLIPYCSGEGLALQKNGKIVIGGTNSKTGKSNFAVARLLFNGAIDSSFGINGTQVTDMGQDFGVCNSAHIQTDGKIVLGGYSNSDISPIISVGLARYYGDPVKKELYVKIKRWLHHHGFTWEDEPGNDISYYSVQRSNGGSAFNEIAKVTGNSKQQSYDDVTATSGNYNYRLAAVSESGNITYSNTLTIVENTTGIKVYPNPVKSSLQIEGLPANATTKITVTDLSGSTRIMTTVKSSNYTLNAGQLTQGNYIIKIESGDVVVTKQFIKE